jgi:aspartate aminotransferase
MHLSRKITRLSASSTLEIIQRAKELEQEGKSIISLCAGEPDFPTPEAIKEAGIKSIRENHTHYTTCSGISELKSAIKEKLKNDNELNYEPNEIIVTVGAKQALYNGLRTLIRHNEEVLIPAPCWVSYVQQIKLAGAKPILVFGETLKPLAKDIERKITKHSKVLIINSPNNPVGYVYTKEELLDIGKLVEKYDLMLISDEIYEKIVYDGVKHYSLPALMPELKERTLVINGFSKAYAMTGWRIGYAAGTKNMISLINRIQSHQTSNTSSIAQDAALEGLSNKEMPDQIHKMVDIFKERRDYLTSEISKIKGLSYYPPEGAFYLFVKMDYYFNEKRKNSMEFCKWLLEEHGLALVPGSAFFVENYVRISYAASMEVIKEGVSRLKKALGECIEN